MVSNVWGLMIQGQGFEDQGLGLMAIARRTRHKTWRTSDLQWLPSMKRYPPSSGWCYTEPE